MPDVAIGYLGVVLALLLILTGVHVGITLALVGTMGIWALASQGAAFASVGFFPFHLTSSFPFAVVPMYILMGEFAYWGGLTQLLFSAAHKWMGRIPGGLPMAVTTAAAGFAAVTGSSMAAATTLTRVALPEMVRYKVHKGLSVAVIAASGSFAVMIPPSGLLIIYGIIADQPIGPLLIAGIVPGVSTAVLYLGFIFVRVLLNREIGGETPPAVPMREKLVDSVKTWPVVALVVLVLGGLFKGVFTPTESGAVGAAGALAITLLFRRMNVSHFSSACMSTVTTTSMLYLVIIGAFLFSKFLALSGVTTQVINFLGGGALPVWLVLTMIILMYLILGGFMEAIGMIAVTVPLALPVVQSFGYNGIWFGIIDTKMTEVAVLTPPLGLNVYAVQAMGRQMGDEMSLGFIFKNAAPFLVMDFLMLAILIVFPDIVTWLPNIAYGTNY